MQWNQTSKQRSRKSRAMAPRAAAPEQCAQCQTWSPFMSSEAPGLSTSVQRRFFIDSSESPSRALQAGLFLDEAFRHCNLPFCPEPHMEVCLIDLKTLMSFGLLFDLKTSSTLHVPKIDHFRVSHFVNTLSSQSLRRPFEHPWSLNTDLLFSHLWTQHLKSGLANLCLGTHHLSASCWTAWAFGASHASW